MFSSDTPITSAAQDEITVQPFLQRLLHPLLQAPPEESLVVGLYAPWGHGKSSILNLLAAELTATGLQQQLPGAARLGTQAVVVRFNPWLYANTDALLVSFFETMAQELGGAPIIPAESRKTLARALRTMGHFAGPLLAAAAMATGGPAGGILAKASALQGFFGAGAEWFSGGEATFRKRRAEAADVLRQLARQGRPLRAVVLIDDLDRADGPEILAMLRLVKLVADLPNVSYVLAMDDERVRDVLASQTSNAYGMGFLEKIVQVPVRLPPVDPELVRTLVLKDAVTIAQRAGLDTQPLTLRQHRELGSPNTYDSLLGGRVRTLRDRARLINLYRFAALTGAAPERHAADLLLLCALQAFYPIVYAHVWEHAAFLLGRDTEFSVARVLRRESQEETLTMRRKLLLDIAGVRTRPAVGASESAMNDQAPLRILEYLFPHAVTGPQGRDIRDLQRDRALARISSPERFDGYFTLKVCQMMFRATWWNAHGTY